MAKGKILLIGGAGYVGSVTAEELANDAKYEIFVLDNLYEGHRKAVHPNATFIEGSMADEKLLDDIFAKHKFDGVMHFAGETVIEYSMTNPFRYFNANIVDGMKVLNAMVKHKVKDFIFSSTSAVYGEAEEIPMPETHRKEPANSYGQSKWIFEQILKWYYTIHGLRSISFRYFNAAGASKEYGEAHKSESHLIPLVLQVALEQRKEISIYGDDYPTRDGTCVRDYTHVIDLARAHIAGLENLDKYPFDAFNLGNGDGYTVREVIDAAREVTGHPIPAKVTPRRAGDAAVMVASSQKAKDLLGWKPRYPLIRDIVKTAWDWHQAYPQGYGKS